MVRAPHCHGGGRGFESLPGRLKMRASTDAHYFCKIWDHISAGRASALQAEGHRFESCWSHLQRKVVYAAVAELADAQDLKSCGTYTPVPVRFRFAALRRLIRKNGSFLFARKCIYILTLENKNTIMSVLVLMVH